MPSSNNMEIYQNTVDRLEPDIHHMDTSACLPSIAISLKRIADSQEKLVQILEQVTSRDGELAFHVAPVD